MGFFFVGQCYVPEKKLNLLYCYQRRYTCIAPNYSIIHIKFCLFQKNRSTNNFFSNMGWSFWGIPCFLSCCRHVSRWIREMDLTVWLLSGSLLFSFKYLTIRLLCVWANFASENKGVQLLPTYYLTNCNALIRLGYISSIIKFEVKPGMI